MFSVISNRIQPTVASNPSQGPVDSNDSEEPPSASLAGKALGVGAAAVWAPVRAVEGAYDKAAESTLAALGTDRLEEGALKKGAEGLIKASPYLAAAATAAFALAIPTTLLGTAVFGGLGLLACTGAPGAIGGTAAAVEGVGKGVNWVWNRLEGQNRALQVVATAVSSPVAAVVGAVANTFSFAQGAVQHGHNGEGGFEAALVTGSGAYNVAKGAYQVAKGAASTTSLLTLPALVGSTASVFASLPGLYEGGDRGAREAYEWGKSQV